MKRFLYLATLVTALFFGGCAQEFDDSKIWEEIDSIKSRVSALETVTNAYKNNLFIKSVNQIDNGYIITFSDGSQATIVNTTVNGDNKDDITYIKEVKIGDDEVTFVLTNGDTFSIPLYNTLSITFENESLNGVQPNSTKEIFYIIKSILPDIEVEIFPSADIKAKIVPDDESGLTGKIVIQTSASIEEDSKVVVFVSNGEKVIMRRISFEEAGLEIEEDAATKQADAEGGEVILEFLSNVECEVVIPEEAQDWISVVPATRAMEKQTITLKLEPNEGHNRSATVTVKSTSGTLKLEYQVDQDGDLGIQIDPTQIPDNEIWYRTSSQNVFTDFQATRPFNSNIVSNEYKNGYGVITCDNTITRVNDYAFANTSYDITELYLPNSVEYLDDCAIAGTKVTTFHIPSNLKAIEGRLYLPDATKFIGEHVSDDGRCVIIDGVLFAFAPKGIVEYTIPLTVESIGDWAFFNSPLQKVVFSENVRVIGHHAFAHCEQLTTVVLNDGCKIIDECAFHNCYKLNDINLPYSLETIGSFAFVYTNIEVITIPDNVNYIGMSPFQGCTNLREFRGKFSSADHMFLSSGGIMFAYAIGAGLGEYSIPEGIEIVNTCTFLNDKNLKKIHFPSTIKIVQGEAFRGCDALEHIGGLYASEDNKCLIIDGCMQLFASKGITEYTIPNGVTEIAEEVFSHNQEIVTLILSDNVEAVGVNKYWGGNGCFIQNCENLKTIILSARLKNLGLGFFYGCI